MKNKNGISLIILVITIVVIIILAAAVILNLGKNNPITNARKAKIVQSLDTFRSDLGLQIANKILKDTTLTINDINSSDEDGFRMSDLIPSIKGTEFETQLKVEKGNLKLRDDSTLADETKEIIKEVLGDVISAKEVADNAATYYGATVTNYSANGVSDWKIFHSDGTNIYLISSEYIPVDKIPKTKGGSKIANASSSLPKSASLNSAANDSNYSNGSQSISESNPARKWLKSYLDNYSSTDDNMKEIAYLLDTDVWNVYKTDKSVYAIGGPTVEMLMASYSNKLGVDYQAKATSEKGYQMSSDGGVNWADSVMISTSETLYVLNSSSGAHAMWLSSPSTASNGVLYVLSSGFVGYNGFAINRIGLRPVVALKSEVSLTRNADGSVTLK